MELMANSWVDVLMSNLPKPALDRDLHFVVGRSHFSFGRDRFIDYMKQVELRLVLTL